MALNATVFGEMPPARSSGMDSEFQNPNRPQNISFTKSRYEMTDLLQLSIQHEASDIHMAVGRPPVLRIHGKLHDIEGPPLVAPECRRLIYGVLNDLPGYGGEHRIIITRQGTMDELIVRFEATHEYFVCGEEAITALANKTSRNLQRTLGVRTKVEVVDANTFPRTEHKARRVIDDRDLFRTLNAKLES